MRIFMKQRRTWWIKVCSPQRSVPPVIFITKRQINHRRSEQWQACELVYMCAQSMYLCVCVSLCACTRVSICISCHRYSNGSMWKIELRGCWSAGSSFSLAKTRRPNGFWYGNDSSPWVLWEPDACWDISQVSVRACLPGYGGADRQKRFEKSSATFATEVTGCLQQALYPATHLCLVLLSY